MVGCSGVMWAVLDLPISIGSAQRCVGVYSAIRYYGAGSLPSWTQVAVGSLTSTLVALPLCASGWASPWLVVVGVSYLIDRALMQPSALLALQAAVQGHSDKFAGYLDSDAEDDDSSEVRLLQNCRQW